MLRDKGEGFGILVSKFPKDTDASYSLQDPSEASPHTHIFIIVYPFKSLVVDLYVFRSKLFLYVLILYKTKSIGDEFLATIGGVETNAAKNMKGMYK